MSKTAPTTTSYGSKKSKEYYKGDIKLNTPYDRKKFVCMACMIPCVAYPYVTGKYTTKPKAHEWMVEKYPASVLWVAELARRRTSNDYDDLDDFVKATNEVLELI